MNRYILDTNVILDDANVLNHFQEGIIVIPLTVIEELDSFKKGLNSLGKNARHFSNIIDELRKNDGDFVKGINIDENLKLKIVIEGKISKESREKMSSFDLKINDNKILLVALSEEMNYPDDEVIFFSKDTNVRIKAATLGIRAENFSKHENLNINEVYAGYKNIIVSSSLVDKLYENKELDIEEEEIKKYIDNNDEEKEHIYPNEYIILQDESEKKYICRYNLNTNSLKLINYPRIKDVYGINARNDEQRIALDMLLNNDIKLVSLIGKAGTGKTLLAIAAALEILSEEDNYERLLVTRPIFPMGRDLGFLPGTMEEKLRPWVQPIYDNIEFLINSDKVEEFLEQQAIKVEALTYIRGRSIPKQILIVDEAQNLTNHEIKTIITRAGEGTKIILTGDPYQIDSPYLDVINNGLVHVIERLKGEEIASTITLTKGERSNLAQIAADKL